MARAPDERQERAKELFLQGMKLIDISDSLGVPVGTIRSWKNRYNWACNPNATLQKKKRNVAKAKGGQPGNKNAVGHGAPEQNKNAVTTGEFETLLFDYLDSEEKKLVAAVPNDKEKLLLQEIQLLTVRERRMLRRIEDLRQTDFTTVKKKKGIEKDKQTDLNEDHATLGKIQSVEDALTRVQARKQRAIEALHKFGFDDARLKLESMRTELAMMKLDQTEEIMESDGFLEALNTEADLLWGDKDGTS